MARKTQASVDLGTLQSNLQDSAAELRSAQTAFQKASERLQAAQEAQDTAIRALNQGVGTLKVSTHVTDLLAR